MAGFRQAIRINPYHAPACNNLGQALRQQGEPDAAAARFLEALRVRPDDAAAHFGLGNAFREQGRLEDAAASYRQAVRLKPDYARAHLNLGNAFKDQGRLDDAIAAYRRAIELEPDDAGYHDNLIMAMHYHLSYDQRAIGDECRRWYRRHAEPFARNIPPRANRPEPERRLRIGYVSPDLRNHADTWFITPLVSNHDHRRFEIFCYSRAARPDADTERLRGQADVCRDAAGLSDQQTADLVRGDQIDSSST